MVSPLSLIHIFVVHGNGGELEAAGLVLLVDLLLDFRVADPPAHILIHSVIGKAQVILDVYKRQDLIG